MRLLELVGGPHDGDHIKVEEGVAMLVVPLGVVKMQTTVAEAEAPMLLERVERGHVYARDRQRDVFLFIEER